MTLLCLYCWILSFSFALLNGPLLKNLPNKWVSMLCPICLLQAFLQSVIFVFPLEVVAVVLDTYSGVHSSEQYTEVTCFSISEISAVAYLTVSRVVMSVSVNV